MSEACYGIWLHDAQRWLMWSPDYVMTWPTIAEAKAALAEFFAEGYMIHNAEVKLLRTDQS